MKITYVNNTDLAGRIFNGYDMMNTLNSSGYECRQIVIDKKSDNDNVYEYLSANEKYISSLLLATESEIGSPDLLTPFTHKLSEHFAFQQADIVHFHLLHNNMISMYELNSLLKSKPCVWTIHDPWLFTGHCIYPLECSKYLTGCKDCSRPHGGVSTLYHHTSEQMWNIKKEQLKDIDIDIVASTDFTIEYLKNSPITSHFTKIHKIPFGIDINRIKNIAKAAAKERLGIPKDDFVIGIRDENNEIKGLKYFIDAIKQMSPEGVTVLSVGSGNMLSQIADKYNCISMGWQNDNDSMDIFYSAADIFVMPSLAESFGLMSIEAMAHETPVICFDNTVLPEITHAGESGIAVEYKNADQLCKAVCDMKNNRDECIRRGKTGRQIVAVNYRYSDYINRHKELYDNIAARI